MTIKKTILITILILAILLSGCEFLDNLRLKILKQVDTTTENVTKKADEVKGQFNKTKDAINQKISDVENAAKEVKEAVDAVKKVTGDGAPAPAVAAGTTTAITK